MSIVSAKNIGETAISEPERRLQSSQSRLQHGVGETLDLSESRAYDAALEITGAYRLTGNFTVDLELVLKDLDVFDKLTFEIKPKSPLSDCRYVEFWPSHSACADQFSEMIRSVRSRIGFDPAPGWWARVFRPSRAPASTSGWSITTSKSTEVSR
jgi:hypothetical protein